MAEKQQQHRFVIEHRMQTHGTSLIVLGQLLGAGLAGICILGGIWLIHGGNSVTGLASLIIPITGLAAVYFHNKGAQPKKQ